MDFTFSAVKQNCRKINVFFFRPRNKRKRKNILHSEVSSTNGQTNVSPSASAWIAMTTGHGPATRGAGRDYWTKKCVGQSRHECSSPLPSPLPSSPPPSPFSLPFPCPFISRPPLRSMPLNPAIGVWGAL